MIRFDVAIFRKDYVFVSYPHLVPWEVGSRPLPLLLCMIVQWSVCLSMLRSETEMPQRGHDDIVISLGRTVQQVGALNGHLLLP